MHSAPLTPVYPWRGADEESWHAMLPLGDSMKVMRADATAGASATNDAAINAARRILLMRFRPRWYDEGTVARWAAEARPVS